MILEWMYLELGIMLSVRENVLHLRRVKLPLEMPDVVPNVARPRLEVRHEDMEVETENGANSGWRRF